MTERDDSVFIGHILDSIEAIEEFSKNITQEELHTNRLKKSAIVREIEIIGEASKNLTPEFRKKQNQIIWKEIIGTRDVMIHQYFGVDLTVLWDILTKDLPKLKKQILAIKKDLEM
jgi:uncharacterized protein with HEPN domain